jgi:hypothetical protein
MRRLPFTQVSLQDLTGLVDLEDKGISRQPWDDFAQGELTEAELRHIEYVVAGLRRFKLSLVNEATVWGRAIFPLLWLAETEGVEVQADVPLFAQLGDVELSGNADGAIGTPFAGGLRAPFLIVVEAKKGVEGSSPVMQLYGEILAAACLNAHQHGHPVQRLYGCYTVADNWTFVRAEVEGLDSPRPRFSLISSWEINEKTEATVIVKILKSIVAEHRRGEGEAQRPKAALHDALASYAAASAGSDTDVDPALERAAAKHLL